MAKVNMSITHHGWTIDAARSLPSLITTEGDGIRDDIAEELDAQMRRRWERVVCQELGVSDTYDKVAVLIVHWEKSLDWDLGVGDEVNELHELFQNDFNYESRVVTLDDRTRPQHQLNSEIADFVRKHDGPHRSNLLILYYSGHGYVRDPGGSEEHYVISGKPEPSGENSGYQAEALWKRAEACLREDAEADTLTIMDCCYAGSIMKGLGEHARLNQVMTASGEEDVATMPGKRSYTRALIDSLKEVLLSKEPADRRIFISGLHQMIRPRTSSRPQLYDRAASGIGRRYICLAPLDKTKEIPAQPQPPNSGHLNLRIAFRDKAKLRDQEVENLAREITQAAKRSELGISAIDWLGFQPVVSSEHFRAVVLLHILLHRAMAKWKLKRERKRKLNEQALREDAREPKRHQQLTGELLEQTSSAPIALHAPLTPAMSSRANTPRSDSQACITPTRTKRE